MRDTLLSSTNWAKGVALSRHRLQVLRVFVTKKKQIKQEKSAVLVRIREGHSFLICHADTVNIFSTLLLEEAQQRERERDDYNPSTISEQIRHL